MADARLFSEGCYATLQQHKALADKILGGIAILGLGPTRTKTSPHLPARRAL